MISHSKLCAEDNALQHWGNVITLTAVFEQPFSLRWEDHERLNGLPVVDDGLHNDRVAGVHDQIRKSLVLGQINLPYSGGGNSRITVNAESVCALASLKDVNGYIAA